MKQKHDGFEQDPPGQLHSEQRNRHPTRFPLFRQQNHSPEVEQPAGQPPPSVQSLHCQGGLSTLQRGAGDPQGLHGPPPQPTHPVSAPSETSVPVRKRPAPSEPAPRNLTNWRRDERWASFRATTSVKSIYAARLPILGSFADTHVHGRSPECTRGWHGIGRSMKQRQHPCGLGHEHSEQRKRHPTRVPLVKQQNHSPDVVQPSGQPPPCAHGLQGIVEHCWNGEPHGLQGPPPQPTQWGVNEAAVAPVRVRKRPAPSEPAPRNLKNWRRDERRASAVDALEARSVSSPSILRQPPRRRHRPSRSTSRSSAASPPARAATRAGASRSRCRG